MAYMICPYKGILNSLRSGSEKIGMKKSSVWSIMPLVEVKVSGGVNVVYPGEEFENNENKNI